MCKANSQKNKTVVVVGYWRVLVGSFQSRGTAI